MPNGDGAAVSIGCAPATTTRSELSRRRSRGQGQTTAPRLPQRAASFLAGGVGGKAKQQAGGRQPPHFLARVVTNTDHNNTMNNSTRAPSSSRGVQWGLSEMPDVATQAHRGPRSQGSDHGSKSQRAGTEKRAGERLLPSRSNSTRKGTHHVVKRPDQAGRRGPARGPTHLHPTWDTTVNPTTTRSYVEVVRGVAQRSGRPATVRGPPHVTRYILLPRAPTHPPQPPSAQQRHEGEGRGFVLRSPKDGLSAGTWRRKVVMCPRRGNDPASGHPRAHQPPLGRGTSPPAWDGRLDAPGQRRRHLPSSAWTRRREVKQGKSGGSVGTTDQGKGKGRSVVRPMGTVAYRGKGQGKGKGRGEGRLGQGGRGRSKGGEQLMGTTAYGGKGSKGRAANGDRPVGAASCRRDHHTMASCQNPPGGMHVVVVGRAQAPPPWEPHAQTHPLHPPADPPPPEF